MRKHAIDYRSDLDNIPQGVDVLVLGFWGKQHADREGAEPIPFIAIRNSAGREVETDDYGSKHDVSFDVLIGWHPLYEP